MVSPHFLDGPGRITFTIDYWKIKQNGIVGILGDTAIAIDYLLRLQGSSNPNTIRAAAALGGEGACG